VIKLKSTSLIQPPAIIAIGSSTGGLKALSKIFEDLKNCKIELPIVITQHIPENFDESFTNKISDIGNRKCVTASDGQELEAGTIYFAPSEKHMLIKSVNDKKIIALDDSAPINFCKPSVDPMLKSVAKLYKNTAMALILTGIGSDGLEGAKDISSVGGAVIAQDKKTSVVWGMPSAVAKEGICNAILPLGEIAGFLKEYSFGKIR